MKIEFSLLEVICMHQASCQLSARAFRVLTVFVEYVNIIKLSSKPELQHVAKFVNYDELGNVSNSRSKIIGLVYM